MEQPKDIRRRGDKLLEVLFDATLKLMREVGPGNLTFQQIADAAKTSRTVLYRRWPTTFELLQEIYTYKAQKLFEGTFFSALRDTGSLRGDLIGLLTLYQEVYMEIGPDILNNYMYLRLQDKENLKEPPIHTAALPKHLQAVKGILDRARKRGESVRKVSRITLLLPFDLIRLENLIRPGNMDKGRIKMMVEEVLLPVFMG